MSLLSPVTIFYSSTQALKQIQISKNQLETDMEKHKFELLEFPILLGELRRAAEECKCTWLTCSELKELNY